MEDNDAHKDEYMRSKYIDLVLKNMMIVLRGMKQMYNRGDLMLNDSVMKRLRQHFNPLKVL